MLEAFTIFFSTARSPAVATTVEVVFVRGSGFFGGAVAMALRFSSACGSGHGRLLFFGFYHELLRQLRLSRLLLLLFVLNLLSITILLFHDFGLESQWIPHKNLLLRHASGHLVAFCTCVFAALASAKVATEAVVFKTFTI